MKKLQNNFTTPKQSKRLLELGVPEDSANCFYTDKRTMIWVRDETDRIDWGAKVGDVPFYLPCWSADRLMEIFDICCIKEEISNNGWRSYRKLYEDQTYIDYVLCVFTIKKTQGFLDFSKLEE